MSPTVSNPLRAVTRVMAALALVAVLGGAARADDDGYEKSEFMIPMRDGVKLHTLVFRPAKTQGALPIILERTPYSADAGGPRALEEYLKDLADDGYLFAFQDIRGRYRSEGSFVMIRAPAPAPIRRPSTRGPMLTTPLTGS